MTEVATALDEDDLFEPEVKEIEVKEVKQEEPKTCFCVGPPSTCTFTCTYCKTTCLSNPEHQWCYAHSGCNKDEQTEWVNCDTCGKCQDHNCTCWVCKKCRGKADHTDSEKYCSNCETCTTCGCSCPKHQYGTSEKPPWELRGTVPKINRQGGFLYEKNYRKQWDFDPKMHDPVLGCAEFYLLELVENAVGPGWSQVKDDFDIVPLREQAKSMRAELVTVWDHVFRKYVAMACWGESRYHVAMGGAKGGCKYESSSVFVSKEYNREYAWIAAKEMEDQIGTPQAYYDLYELFSEMDGSCYGGKKWADAMRLLADRCNGLIPPDIFVDRIFSMQHNGGSLLNKVTWGRLNRRKYDITAIQSRVGPAHADNPPDFDTLCGIARVEVVELFEKYISRSDKIRRRMKVEPFVSEEKAKEKFWRTVPVHVKELARRDKGAAFEAYCQWQDETRANPQLLQEETQDYSDEGPCECSDCVSPNEPCGECEENPCVCCSNCGYPEWDCEC